MSNLYIESEKLKAELKIFKLKSLKEKVVLFGVVLLILVELIVVISFLKKSGFFGENAPHTPYVAVIDFNKQITTDYIHKIISKMEIIKDDKDVKEVLIVFNTPGGSPSASDEFNAYLKDYTKTKKVNVYIESMAASGGYYIISAIKPIIANKNAVVGSIGVIMPHYVVGKLAKKIGIEQDNIAVGKYKEPISLFEKASEEQKEYLYSHLLNPTYTNFLNIVAQDRNISIEKLKKYADGKIFIANQVKGILVDKISTLVDVKKEIKKEIAKRFKLKENEIKFYKISMEDKKLPFFKVEVENSTLNTLTQGLNLK
jgi:protease-4